MDMRIPRQLVASVDAWRRSREEIPSRCAAVRELVSKALSAEAEGEKGDGKTLAG